MKKQSRKEETMGGRVRRRGGKERIDMVRPNEEQWTRDGQTEQGKAVSGGHPLPPSIAISLFTKDQGWPEISETNGNTVPLGEFILLWEIQIGTVTAT